MRIFHILVRKFSIVYFDGLPFSKITHQRPQSSCEGNCMRTLKSHYSSQSSNIRCLNVDTFALSSNNELQPCKIWKHTYKTCAAGIFCRKRVRIALFELCIESAFERSDTNILLLIYSDISYQSSSLYIIWIYCIH